MNQYTGYLIAAYATVLIGLTVLMWRRLNRFKQLKETILKTAQVQNDF